MKYFIILLMMGVVVGCSDPMDEKITKSNYPELLAKIKSRGSEDDQKKAVGVIMANEVRGFFAESDSSLDGKSFNEHVAIFKDRFEKIEAEAKIQNEKERLAKEEKDRIFNEEVTKIHEQTAMFEFSKYKKSNWETDHGIKRYVEITIEVKNVSDKEIDAYQGWLKVYDKLDNELANFYIKDTKLLKPKSVRKIASSRELNQFIQDRIEEVDRTPVEDLRFKFFIEKIVLK